MKANIGFFGKIYYLLEKDQKKLFGLIVLFILLSLLDAVGIALIGPYVSIMLDPLLLKDSFVVQEILKLSGFSLDEYGLQIAFSVVIIFLFLFKSLAAIFIFWVVASFSYQQQVRIRSTLMHYYQSMLYIDYVGRNSSEYLYSIQALASLFTGKVLMTGLKTISDIVIVLAIVIVLGMTDIVLLGVLLFLLGASMFLYDRTLSKKIQDYGKKSNTASTQMVKGINEGIEGMKELRILGKQKYFYDVVRKSAISYATNLKMTDILSTVPRYLIEFVVIGFLALMVIIELVFAGNITELIPVLAMFGVAALRLVPSVYSISTGLIQLHFNRNTVSLLYKDVKNSENITDSNKISTSNEVLEEEFNEISLQSVKYRYASDLNPVLNGITISIKRGDSIGLMGSSGSGKTTMIDVLLGLLEPQEGEVLFNGKNIRDCLVVWQNKIAYLPQEIFIIDDTLKSNIALGIDPLEINAQRLDDVIKRTRLKKLIENLPEGIDTPLGEHGVRLSGGQRQRIALARALYHNRSVLIMDEATSSLDNVTEREIVDEIQMLKGNTTMIVIAHRYQTLEHCDPIYRLEEGKIVEVTTFEKLVSS